MEKPVQVSHWMGWGVGAGGADSIQKVEASVTLAAGPWRELGGGQLGLLARSWACLAGPRLAGQWEGAEKEDKTFSPDEYTFIKRLYLDVANLDS